MLDLLITIHNISTIHTGTHTHARTQRIMCERARACVYNVGATASFSELVRQSRASNFRSRSFACVRTCAPTQPIGLAWAVARTRARCSTLQHAVCACACVCVYPFDPTASARTSLKSRTHAREALHHHQHQTAHHHTRTYEHTLRTIQPKMLCCEHVACLRARSFDSPHRIEFTRIRTHTHTHTVMCMCVCVRMYDILYSEMAGAYRHILYVSDIRPT